MFPVNIAKFLRTPILKNIWEELLLHYQSLKSSAAADIPMKPPS